MDVTETVDVDQLVAQLDARCATSGEHWDVYRAHDGRWIATTTDRRLKPDPAAVKVDDRSLPAVLTGLLARPRLPVVPPRPLIPYLQVTKVDGWWEIQENGRFAGHRERTKKRAQEIVDRWTQQQSEAQDVWDRQWGVLVATGVENVDYYRVSAP